MKPFGAPTVVVSDSGSCFTSRSPVKFMESHGTEWCTALACTPMSNGRAERMVGTAKGATARMMVESGKE